MQCLLRYCAQLSPCPFTTLSYQDLAGGSKNISHEPLLVYQLNSERINPPPPPMVACTQIQLALGRTRHLRETFDFDPQEMRRDLESRCGSARCILKSELINYERCHTTTMTLAPLFCGFALSSPTPPARAFRRAWRVGHRAPPPGVRVVDGFKVVSVFTPPSSCCENRLSLTHPFAPYPRTPIKNGQENRKNRSVKLIFWFKPLEMGHVTAPPCFATAAHAPGPS